MKQHNVETIPFIIDGVELISFEIAVNVSAVSRNLCVNGKCCHNPDATKQNAVNLNVRVEELARSLCQTYEIERISVSDIRNLQSSSVRQNNLSNLGK
jgi:hypothetical protein